MCDKPGCGIEEFDAKFLRVPVNWTPQQIAEHVERRHLEHDLMHQRVHEEIDGGSGRASLQ